MNSALRRGLLMTAVGAILTAPGVRSSLFASLVCADILQAMKRLFALAILFCLTPAPARADFNDRTIFFGPAVGQDLSIFEEHLYE